MSKKIADAFKNGKAFIPFITAGDPGLDATKRFILEMEKAGADLVEIGIPFSDKRMWFADYKRHSLFIMHQKRDFVKKFANIIRIVCGIYPF
jgi:hypothetical protein